jgi:hypothetical protein
MVQRRSSSWISCCIDFCWPGCTGLMPRERGHVQVVGKLYLCLEHPLLIDGSTFYAPCAQEWLLNRFYGKCAPLSSLSVAGTIQENVLFGLPYDEVMYKRALYCSCLENKLEQVFISLHSMRSSTSAFLKQYLCQNPCNRFVKDAPDRWQSTEIV